MEADIPSAVDLQPTAMGSGAAVPRSFDDRLPDTLERSAQVTAARDSHGVTQLLLELRGGDEAALDRLLPIVYDELRQIARRQLGGQAAGHTLSTTALVHEAYLKLAGGAAVAWNDRVHFFRVAARAMRQVLINHAHRHATAKRGSGWERVPWDDAVVATEMASDMLLSLDEAMTRLATLNSRLSQVVEYRFFGGMTEEEVAAVLDVTARTVRRDWLKARLWLYTEMTKDAQERDPGTSS